MTTKAAQDQDQSMEEILQSIKRIIADEDDMTQATKGSDVLELTEIVQDNPNAPLDLTDEAPLDVAPMPPSDNPSRLDAMKGLVSDDAASATASSLRALADKARPGPKPAPKVESPSFRSGNTVEDLMLEAMRPMLKAWLDANLPQIVEHLVEKEIRRISH